jgi:uncharacterized protein
MNTEAALANVKKSVEGLGSTLSKDELSAFLGDIRFADNTLNMAQTEGFLFALACCPKPVPEEDWLRVVLGDAIASAVVIPTQISLTDIIAALVQMFHSVEGEVASLSYRLPADLSFSWDALERRPLEQWCEGMLLADEWLEKHWRDGLARLNRADSYAYSIVSDELDDTVGLVNLLADIDHALEVLETKPEESMLDLRQRLRESYDTLGTCLFHYMQAGKVLAEYYVKRMPQVRSEPKVGRNDPCLCGSGIKYKKCCMTCL